jgi:uncharacterized protein
LKGVLSGYNVRDAMIVRRQLQLRRGKHAAFLWGPRQVGKTHWIREHFSASHHIIDLLQSDVFAELASRPALLRERWTGKPVVIDEVQKLPALLDEVHWLIENRRAEILLTGSSARKLRRSHANLLGGRARRYEMGPLSFCEVKNFDLESVAHSGLLPPHYLSDDLQSDLRSYVSDYLREEIAQEAAVRNLPAFSNFLRAAAISNAELINYTNVASDCGVSAKVVKGYFEILEDTLLGSRLPAWQKSKNRRLIGTEKFYWFDVGVSNYLARRRPLLGSGEFGKSFEHLIWMELANYRRYRVPEMDMAYWRTTAGQEVDFVISDMALAIECKASSRIATRDLSGLRALHEDRRAKHRMIVCLESVPRRLDEGIEIVPWRQFLERLWSDEWQNIV